MQADLKAFIAEQKLAHVIVINVSSTEPAVDPSQFPANWSELDKLIDKPTKCLLPASSLYAIAAMDLGYSYLNFTPSLGASLPAIDELAGKRSTRHMGYDGKTGETLLKSILAPMFADRNLHVMSWVGPQHFWQHGRPSFGRPGKQGQQGDEQGSTAERHPSVPSADAGFDRIHQEHGRLENSVGSRAFPGFFGHSDDFSVHLAGMRFLAWRHHWY